MKELTKEEILKIYIAYYPKDEQCVFTSHTASEICKGILDQNTKPLIDIIEHYKETDAEYEKQNKALIDEIAELRKQFEQSDKMYSDLLAKKDDFKLKWEKSVDEITKLKASKPEANEWISVLLGLPNDGIEVSVRLDCAYNGNGIIEPKSSAKFNHSTKYWESGLSTLYSVTHWKPTINTK